MCMYVLHCEMFLSVHTDTTHNIIWGLLNDHKTVLMAWPPILKGDVKSPLPFGFNYSYKLRVEI